MKERKLKKKLRKRNKRKYKIQKLKNDLLINLLNVLANAVVHL